MSKVRGLTFILILMLFFYSADAMADVSIGYGAPYYSIGINLVTFPRLVPIPNYPVYYAPDLEVNYFFYDGLYWVYRDSNWYASTWYNGPWSLVSTFDVPAFILRIPVRYYRSPPFMFRSWYQSGPPHWGVIWGRNWEASRRGWDRWNHNVIPPRAPIPLYQRRYPKARYPNLPAQRRQLEREHYRYQPRNPRIHQFFNQPRQQRPQEQRRMRERPRQGEIRQSPNRRPNPKRNIRNERGQ